METNNQSKASWFWGEGWSRFGAFAVLGGLSILAAHALFPQARWPIAVLAVVLMLAFGFSERRYKQGQEDRLGDNLYYLGLTYTLRQRGSCTMVVCWRSRCRQTCIRFQCRTP